MRCALLALTVTAVAVAVAVYVPTAGAAAAPGIVMSPRSPTDTPCTAEYDLTLDPGFSTTPSAGTFTTGGETGNLVCTGTVNGKSITGNGTIGEAGRYGTSGPTSCTKLDGEFVQKIAATLPTADGPVHLIDNPVRGTYGPLQGGGVVGGTVEGSRFYGTFTALPLEGTCAVTPLTKAHISLRGWIVEKP